MSLKDKLDEVAQYINTKHPEINLENVLVCNSHVTNIYKIIFQMKMIVICKKQYC